MAGTHRALEWTCRRTLSTVERAPGGGTCPRRRELAHEIPECRCRQLGSKQREDEPKEGRELLHASSQFEHFLLEFGVFVFVTSRVITTFVAPRSHPRARGAREAEILWRW